MQNWKRVFILLMLVAVGPCLAGEYFNSDGVRIYYAVEGKGEPVVLIHGWVVDSSMWGAVATTLAREFRVIALDCRGHGKSDKPHDPQAYGPQIAQDVVRLLDHLGIVRAHLVGYSMGAILAGEILAEHPERVLSAVFAGGAPVLEWDEDDLRETEAFLDRWNRDGLLQLLTRLVLGDVDRVALTWANRSLREIRVSPTALQAYPGPVLFIYGSNDWPSTKRYVAAARLAFRQSDLVVIPGADHLSTPSRREFAKNILQFLCAARPPSAPCETQAQPERSAPVHPAPHRFARDLRGW